MRFVLLVALIAVVAQAEEYSPPDDFYFSAGYGYDPASTYSDPATDAGMEEGYESGYDSASQWDFGTSDPGMLDPGMGTEMPGGADDGYMPPDPDLGGSEEPADATMIWDGEGQVLADEEDDCGGTPMDLTALFHEYDG